MSADGAIADRRAGVRQMLIEKGVPMPPAYRPARAVRYSYPWGLMVVGDSILVPLDAGDPARVLATVKVGASLAGKRLDARFETRLVEGGIRVWRTK